MTSWARQDGRTLVRQLSAPLRIPNFHRFLSWTVSRAAFLPCIPILRQVLTRLMPAPDADPHTDPDPDVDKVHRIQSAYYLCLPPHFRSFVL